jgi:hypothetical protein
MIQFVALGVEKEIDFLTKGLYDPSLLEIIASFAIINQTCKVINQVINL